MSELTLRDVPPRLMNDLREWATLRRSTIEAAAVEMIRIGPYQTREQGTPSDRSPSEMKH